MRVVIAGGGLAGLACAKYLVDMGHQPILLERSNVLGGLVAAWKDADGDWVETGLHNFFGAYPNMLQLMGELNILDRLQWKRHALIFNQPEKPGVLSWFDVPDLPAPFNIIISILRNNDMLTWNQKIRFAIGLIPAIVRGDKYVASMDKYTFEEWLQLHGIGKDITTDIFIAVCKSLKFIDPDVISATIPLRALNKFLQQKDGSKIAYLDGAPPERLCQPIVDYVVARGGEVHTGVALKEIVTNADGNVEKLIVQGTDGTLSREIYADAYVSAMSVDAFKNYIPANWQALPYFQQLDNLEGVPVISVQLWFDRKLTDIDHTLFSRSPLLSVYSDMSNSCKEYADPDKSMLELVFAPAADWIDRPNSDIIDATLSELAKLFPQHLPSPAKVLKSHVVKTRHSIYTATPNREQFRPQQITPIANFFLSGSYTAQPFFGSMEGAVLSGKLTAQEIHNASLNASKSSGSKVLGRTSNQNQSNPSVVSA
ncbi:15-cis-phytoene desaturase [Pseudanabaena sp. FACHB-1277]|uniref:Phytoene dehydrogenase n=1 Tax=Pseudanabaena cinerea FACHB-1277 TaxID=2949581 RepID=A0A926UWB9_9CYAN|nr:15-cis-phytoene desaturase [Pseudanabaena cinerea]MBD2152264.1 15-cis-phytoene desaturase [Pseudanabaena cinerea FACHB-1277]